MKNHLVYKNALIVVVYGIIVQLCILPFFEIITIKPETIKIYFFTKIIIIIYHIIFLFLLYTRRLSKIWVYIFYIGAFAYILSGQYFHNGYQYAVIELMFINAIVFEGFSIASTALVIIFIVECIVFLLEPSLGQQPNYHSIIINALLSSWFISIVLERYVNRVKHKQDFLDKKLRYTGIKTELLLHEIKNQLQPLIFKYANDERFQDILTSIQSFNSFQENNEVLFKDIVSHTKEKFNINGLIETTGTSDFFIDQMDLQTILSNLMTNSVKAGKLCGKELKIIINNTNNGFTYEDNAGGLTDEQFKFFCQKKIMPYPGHEKNGLGILLIKKLVEHQGGKFILKRVLGGTKFEINY
jgi:hypothetical protein